MITNVGGLFKNAYLLFTASYQDIFLTFFLPMFDNFGQNLIKRDQKVKYQ